MWARSLTSFVSIILIIRIIGNRPNRRRIILLKRSIETELFMLVIVMNHFRALQWTNI